MRKYQVLEIYFASPFISRERWTAFIEKMSLYQGAFCRWGIFGYIEQNKVHYFIVVKKELPISFYEFEEFHFKKVKMEIVPKAFFAFPTLHLRKNLLELFEERTSFKKEKFSHFQIKFCLNLQREVSFKIYLYFWKDKLWVSRLFLVPPSMLLSIDFRKSGRFLYQKMPNYLLLDKWLSYLSPEQENPLLEVEGFPYIEGSFFLSLDTYKFAAHSLILGQSGAGKSKWVSHFIQKVAGKKDQYKVVIIDPHASLEKDVGGLEESITVDFLSPTTSISLFPNDYTYLPVSVEHILSLCRPMIQGYNAKLERVLRYSIYLLLTMKTFSFENLKKVLIDLNYRLALLKEADSVLDDTISNFFLNDYTSLKNQSYNEAIAPILSFIDEMMGLPVFSKKENYPSLKQVIEENYLTILSLDEARIGKRVGRMVAGLFMQELLNLVQSYSFTHHILFIIDEVSVVDNPILLRFLAESRKYNVSLFLTEQYFGQMSEDLQKAIFANTLNYYIFRTSKRDAIILEEELSLKFFKKTEDCYKIFTGLKDRECIVRVGRDGALLPSFKAMVPLVHSYPRKVEKSFEIEKNIASERKKTFIFEEKAYKMVREMMRESSTSRKRKEEFYERNGNHPNGYF